MRLFDLPRDRYLVPAGNFIPNVTVKFLSALICDVERTETSGIFAALEMTKTSYSGLFRAQNT